MAISQMTNVIQQLHKALLVQDAPDGQLLENFIRCRDEAALEALVRRHGPMVWNVCRRVLHNHQDAEDAFQATFLVFVRKAPSIVPREMVGNWLYGVAHQTALKARATAAKRRTREKQVTEMPEPAMNDQEHWTDLQPILDQEITRLPDKYRIVIVLCDLEGKTRSQAAQQLDWPEGTVAGRLARARTTLAKRLSQRGIVLSGGALAAVMAQQAVSACVPSTVVTTTIKTATLVAAGQTVAAGAIPAKVAALTEGVMKAMLLSKLKTVSAVLVAGIIALGGGLFTYQTFGETNIHLRAEGPDRKPAEDAEQPAKESLLGSWIVTSVKGDTEIKLDQDWRANVESVSFQAESKVRGAEVPSRISIELKDGRRLVRVYSVNGAAKPPTIDLHPHQDEENAGISHGIFQIDGESLTMCLSRPGRERPKDFEVKASSHQVVLVLKRDRHAKPAKAKSDRELIQGNWKVTRADFGGKHLPQEEWTGDDQVWSIADGKITITYKGGDKKYLTFGLDPTKNPKAIDVTEKDYGTYLGIYALDGDRLEIAYSRGSDGEKKRMPAFKRSDLLEDRGLRHFVLERRTDEPAKEPRLVPIANYPAQDRAADKRIRELLEAAKIQAITVGSRGVTVNVAADKAKAARAILEKAVTDGTLTVQILDQLPVPKNLRAVRADDKLRIEEDPASIEEVIVPVAAGLRRGNHCELSVYRGKERVVHSGGTYLPTHDFIRPASKIPQPGESYEVELRVYWFETDAPVQPNWKPESGGKYKVILTRTLKLNVGPKASDAAKEDADPLSAYPRSDAFVANVAWHKKVGAFEVRMSWFVGGKPGVAMVCTAELPKSKVTTWREVYDHAHQNTMTRDLSDAQVRSLHPLIANLPPSAKAPEFKNLVLVSVSEKGKAKTYLYNRLDLPPAIIRLYDLTGASVDTIRPFRFDPVNVISKDDRIYPLLAAHRAAMQKREEEKKEIRSTFSDWVGVDSLAAARLFPKLRFAALRWDMHQHPENKGRPVSLALGLETVLAIDTTTNRLATELFCGGNHEAYGKLLVDHKAPLRDTTDAKLVWDAFCEIHRGGNDGGTMPKKKISASEWHLGISSIDQTKSVVDGVKTVVTYTYYHRVLVDPKTGQITSWEDKVDSSNERKMPAQ